uniref:Uncharacterized protein n=1 Tax=Equus asinus TaxID=9793 RepID=A0A8C4LYK0_EQUAS
MDMDIPQAFQKELTCLICLNCLMDPVTIDCGHSFSEPPACCPVCRQPSQQTDYKTNILLKSLVSIARKASLRQCLSSEEHMCGTHKETKKIFCEDNRSLLCLLCSESQEHEAHSHCSVEEAAEEYRVSDASEGTLKTRGEKSISLQCYVYKHEDIIRAVYQPLHPSLRKEEKQHLESLKKQGNSVFKQLQKIRAEMVEKRIQLRLMYEELLETCHKSDVELLLVSTEDGSAGILYYLKPTLLTSLIYLLLKVYFFLSCVYVTNHNIRLFDDVRSVRYIHDSRYVSLNPGTSNYFASWGTQDFTSGKHYWEVIVDRSWDWAVGVCRDSWIRKTGTLVESKDTFLLVCVKEDDRYSLWTTAPISPQFIAKPVGRVGVFLDLDSRSMSFVDVARRSIIWRYPDGVFTFPVRPFFYTGHT